MKGRDIAAAALMLMALRMAPAGAMERQVPDSASVSPPARLIVTADAESVAVYLDGVFAGTTPLTLDSLAAGPHTLSALARNPVSWYRKVDTASIQLLPGDSRHFRFSILTPLRLNVEAVPMVSPLLGEVHGNGRTIAILATGGATVAAGIVAAYYKIAADDRNEEFLASGNRALLDERRRLDTAAGIAFAAMEVGFAIFTWLLMAE